MAASAFCMSKSTFVKSIFGLLTDLDPLRQMRADLKSANDVFALIHDTVFE